MENYDAIINIGKRYKSKTTASGIRTLTRPHKLLNTIEPVGDLNRTASLEQGGGMDSDQNGNDFSELRSRAMAFLAEQPKMSNLTQSDFCELIHQLNTYHIELELQNEDLRKAQQELEKSQCRYTDLCDFMPVGYLTINDNGLIRDANVTIGDMLGTPRGQLISRPFSDFIVQDDQDLFYRFRKKLLQTRIKQSFELQLQPYNRPSFHAHLEMSVQYEDCDSPGQFRVAVSDISSLKAAELAKIRRIKNRYQAIVMDQHELICRFDPQNRITFVNDAFCRYFDVKYQKILGMTLRPWTYKEDLAFVRNDFDDLTLQKPEKTIEHRIRLPNGKIAWLQSSCRAIYDHDGVLVKYQVVSRDITALKTTEEDLRKTQDALKRANEELEQRVVQRTLELKKSHEQLLHSEKLSVIGKFSASIAHEFNNPLQSVVAVLKGLGQYALLNVEEKEMVSLALEECLRMKNLVADLRDFAQPSSGKATMVDLHATLDTLLLLSQKDLQGRNIRVVKKYAKDLPLVPAVVDQLKQVFLNLLNNGVDACTNEGIITITTETLNQYNVAVHFEDNGIGINSENIGHIFEPFFTTKPEPKGTGLGLSVSYGIVKKHRGRIEVRSDPGKGSVFSVYLPVQSEDNGR